MIRDPRYDRSRLLEAATRAVATRRIAKAVALYRWVLAFEPTNAEIHLKLAPLLAQRRAGFDAWKSFQAAARARASQGHPERALAIYRQAAAALPREIEVWQATARLQQRGGRAREALETLLEGSRRLRRCGMRPQAIHLLRLAREIEAWHFEGVHGLARLLGGDAQREEARILLAQLARRCGGARLRRVRAAQLRLSPTPANAWRWLVAVLRDAPEPVVVEGRSEVVRLRRPRLRAG